MPIRCILRIFLLPFSAPKCMHAKTHACMPKQVMLKCLFRTLSSGCASVLPSLRSARQSEQKQLTCVCLPGIGPCQEVHSSR